MVEAGWTMLFAMLGGAWGGLAVSYITSKFERKLKLFWLLLVTLASLAAAYVRYHG